MSFFLFFWISILTSFGEKLHQRDEKTTRRYNRNGKKELRNLKSNQNWSSLKFKGSLLWNTLSVSQQYWFTSCGILTQKLQSQAALFQTTNHQRRGVGGDWGTEKFLFWKILSNTKSTVTSDHHLEKELLLPQKVTTSIITEKISKCQQLLVWYLWFVGSISLHVYF